MMSSQNIKLNSSIDGPFDGSSTTSREDLVSFDAISVFTSSVIHEDEEAQKSGKSVDVEDENIAKEEEEAVARLKVVVMTVLFVSVIGMTLAVYFYASRVESNKFEEVFILDSTQFFVAVHSAFAAKLLVMHAFLTNVDAFMSTSNTTWPFVTTPEFAARASDALLISDAAKLSQYHFVSESQLKEWNEYTAANDAWVQDSLEFQASNAPWNDTRAVPPGLGAGFSTLDMESSYLNDTSYLALWQNFPIEEGKPAYSIDGNAVSPVLYSLPYVLNGSAAIGGLVEQSSHSGHEDHAPAGPPGELFVPIVADSSFSMINGILSLQFFWKDIFAGVLPSGTGSITIVVSNDCNETFSFEVDGEKVSFLGFADFHDDKYDYLEEYLNLTEIDMGISQPAVPLGGMCAYSLSMYPTESKEEAFHTTNPLILSLASLVIFLFTAAHFTLYDYVVEVKNQKVMNSAAKSNAIIKSLFPSTVRGRILEADPAASKHFVTDKTRLGSFLRTGKTGADSEENVATTRPIADLFPNTTVMFADIAGFTAWSSVREPSHVFTLLEAIYFEFDSLCKKRKVFKVETIGDAYVAVAGLPEPRVDHAVVMVKFARDCRVKSDEITRKLETTLGPGTAELRYRFGLHSGPVTAGVLRGEKARFQLFGDTVNTAARMETLGFPGRIHISESTAQQLVAAGKSHWVIPREEKVEAKGKGFLQTYWIEQQSSGHEKKDKTSRASPDFSQSSTFSIPPDRKIERLVSWNTDVLKRMLEQIIACRGELQHGGYDAPAPVIFGKEGTTIIDEVQEIIALPEFDASSGKKQMDPDSIELDAQVYAELKAYVTAIAQSYRRNSFHSFDHASHVLMSVSKLLNRIVAPDLDFPEAVTGSALDASFRERLHDHTFGITSSPLTQFACIFAALIHDVDHQGIPNAQLVKEEQELARKYGDIATAEQHSVNVAWDLLMSDNFDTLRKAICPTESELQRFRQLVVNSVISTDIVHPDLRKLRNDRWEKAFSSDYQESDRDRVNRKATIVIEHLIQASDVAHTMQHWHVYCKWNAKLFEEMYTAYREGRASKDPSEFWYQGEMQFFDHYVIPLAKKLRDCGVFGVSSEEYLNYALKNREEWERRGESVVATLVEKVRRKEETTAMQ